MSATPPEGEADRLQVVVMVSQAGATHWQVSYPTLTAEEVEEVYDSPSQAIDVLVGEATGKIHDLIALREETNRAAGS